MDEQNAKAFITALGSKQIKSRTGWVVGTCPLAPWTHKSGKDTNPSFGLTVAPGQHSNYNCYACASGSAEELLQTLEMYWAKDPRGSPMDFASARQLLEDEELAVLPLPGYQEFAPPPHGVFEEWPLHFINSFLPALGSVEAKTYLYSRLLTDEEILRWGLRWDSQRRMIVAPFYNVYSQLAGARGRSVEAGTLGWNKHFDYTFNKVNNSNLVWFNEQSLQLPGPVVVVEGQFDAMRVAKVYPKVVANLTGKPVIGKLHRLLQSSQVIHLPDNDGVSGTGDKTITLYRQYCMSQSLPYVCEKLPLPTGREKIDPGDCHPDFLRSILSKYIENL